MSLNKEEMAAVNSLVNQYISCLCIRERITKSIPLLNEHYPKLLYEVEMELQEIRLILNTFLLDDHRD